MSDKKKRKHSRSRSRDNHKKRKNEEEKFNILQDQIHNLTKVVEKLVNGQKDQTIINQPMTETLINEKNDTEENDNKENDSPKKDIDSEEIEIIENPDELTIKNNVLKVLGLDQDESSSKEIKYHPQLKDTWTRWIKEGLPENKKKEILSLYNRKGELFVEAPKVNLEIIPLLTDIAKKRDQHFLDTQNSVGTALAALGAAISMVIDPPEEDVDEDIITNYLSHVGQILTDVFYQQSVARKSFITPQLNKNIKPTVDAMSSDEWLYGNNLKDKVKDAKEIEKACAEIKDKSQNKNYNYNHSRNQGNAKYPPASYRQVGHQHPKRRIFSRYKKRHYPNSTQTSSKTNSTNQSSSSRK